MSGRVWPAIRAYGLALMVPIVEATVLVIAAAIVVMLFEALAIPFPVAIVAIAERHDHATAEQRGQQRIDEHASYGLSFSLFASIILRWLWQSLRL
jgi:hypothetical protein